jgi:hypothetical protein
MFDRDTFDRIKQRHGGYASWAVWAEADKPAKSNMEDLGVLDPDRNPRLLAILTNDVVMLGLAISAPLSEPFQNFHGPSGGAYKIRHAFEDTPYYGAYMTDFIKGVVIPEANSARRYLAEHPLVVRENIQRFLAELDDLRADRPTILTFGGDTYRLVANNLPREKYSRLIPIMSYGNYISQQNYRQAVLEQIGSNER